jgi:hypothetical protein
MAVKHYHAHWLPTVQPDIAERGILVGGVTATVIVNRSNHPVSAISSIGVTVRITAAKNVPQIGQTFIGTIPLVNHTRGSGVSVITEDASTPLVTQHTGSTSPITSPLFSPPANSLLVALVGGGWGSTLPTSAVVTDSLGNTWSVVAVQPGTVAGAGGVALIALRYFTAAPGSMTVSAAYTNLSGGSQLDVRVLNGAASDQSAGAIGLAQYKTNNNAATVSITTTRAGSRVYGVTDQTNQSFTLTPNAATSILTQFLDSTDAISITSWKAANATSTPGVTTLGGNWGAGSYESNIATFEILPAGGPDNRAQTSVTVLGALGLTTPKKVALPLLRGVLGLSAYRTIQTAVESGRTLLGVTALVTPIKNAIVSVRAAVGAISRVTDTKTVSTATAGRVGVLGRVTESRSAAVVSSASAGIIGRVAGLARTTPIIARAYGGVTARSAVVKSAPSALRSAAGLTSSTTPRKVAIVVELAPIGVTALRSSTPSIAEIGRGVIGVTVTAVTVKRSPVSVVASVSALGTARAAKSSAQRALAPIGTAATSRPIKRAAAVAYSSLGAIGRVLDVKSAPTALRPAVGVSALATARKAAGVYTSAIAGVAGLATVRKTTSLTARATVGLLARVTPAKTVLTHSAAVLGIAATRTFVAPGWPPRPMAITLTRTMAAGTVYLTTSSTRAQTELTTTAAAGTTELTEPAHADTEMTRPTMGDTEITH